MATSSDHPYSALTPDTIMDAVESKGLYCDYRLYPLNSYENRVYQVGIEDSTPLIAKFYRPQRWSKAQIQVEHDALHALEEEDIAVAAPIILDNESLFEHNGFYFSLTPKIIGDSPEAGDLDQLFQIGELIGSMHAASADWTTDAKPFIDSLERVKQAKKKVEACPFVPKSMRDGYEKVVVSLGKKMEAMLKTHSTARIRFIHGDCHRSNIINDQGRLTLVDFDDCKMGYAVQDLWLHITDASAKQTQLSELIEGYESFCSFDAQELDLIDVMMAERHISYTAWIAERWNDPAFPAIFPHFIGEDFWRQHLHDLNDIVAHWGKWR